MAHVFSSIEDNFVVENFEKMEFERKFNKKDLKIRVFSRHCEQNQGNQNNFETES